MKLLLVDGSAVLHRAYHAYPPLTNREGKVVGAVYGVASILITALSETEPTQVVVAWDLPKPTFRHAKYVGYKAQRPKADTEMVEQIPLVKELITAMGLLQLEQEGYEADDIIGTLAFQAENAKLNKLTNEEIEVVILTGDQDTMQLVTDKVKIMTPAKGKNPPMVYGVEQVKEKYGVTPKQIVDYKALIGDPSDNIPGVAGIGPKGAAGLLNQFGTLENIYAQMHNLTNEKLREKLEKGKESAFLSQDLSRIVTTMELPVTGEEMEYRGLNRQELREKLEELSFKSLVRRLWPPDPTSSETTLGASNQMGLF